MKIDNAYSNKKSDLLPFEMRDRTMSPIEQGGDFNRVKGSEGAFRPIQYLGSKKRSLGFIVNVVKSIPTQPLTVFDIFSGTSIVSQALARAGYNVLATDAMAFCAVFARTFLGVGRRAREVDTNSLINLLKPSGNPIPIEEAFRPWVVKEEGAIKRSDSDALLEISTTIPQIWRTQHASSELLSQFELIGNMSGQAAFATASLICTHYAGTYFGITQAIEIDRIRVAIERLYGTAQINQWERDLLTTTLLSVSSDCAFSPGKHFAQSHLIREGKDLTFIRGRVLQDRAINVWARFCKKLELIAECADEISGEHYALQATFENIVAGKEQVPSFSLIYADPPYTAQQYSRFYHLPETIVSYEVPKLQQHRGGVTRGLYPEHRFKSRFSSKREAPRAFNDLFEFAKRGNASLLISYSDTSTGQTGNDRMISMNELLDISKKHFSADKMQIFELDHEYRQFNHTNAAVTGRLDKEYLILCERTC